jgi:hypothetical protein
MSDERRERVAQAISDALPRYMQARGALDPTGKPGYWWPDGEGTQALATAALAAVDAAGESVTVSRDDLRAVLDAFGWADLRDTTPELKAALIRLQRRIVEANT